MKEKAIKRGRGSQFSKESRHPGCFDYHYFVNSLSWFKTFSLNKQPQMTKVFYHLRLRRLGGPSPPPVIPQQLGSKSQKRVPSVTFTPLLLSSPILYYHWYWGWHFNTHVKKLKAVCSDVVLLGSPSVLARPKNKKKSAKLLLQFVCLQ